MRTRDALLRRGTAHRAVLAAAFATVLLTLTVATAVALLHRAANDAAVTGVLTDATVADRVVQVRTELEADTDVAALDERVRSTLASSLAAAEPVVRSRTVSASYSLPGPDADEPDLTVFASYGDELADSAELVDGSWPSSSSSEGRVAVAMPSPAAERLDVAPGDRWTVLNRFTDEPVEVELAGVFVVDDPDAPAWLGDPLVTRGVATGSFTTYGPLVVPPTTFAERFLDEATGAWTADPQLRGVAPGELPALRSGVAALEDVLDAEGLAVETDLPEVLERVETPLTATRATVVLGAAPLVLLAVAALLTAGRLLGDRRRVELALLRARGASTAQLGTLSLLEALALTVPAALLAPLLARLLVGTWGPDRVSGAGLPRVDGTAWLLAALAGLVSGLVLVLPSWRREELSAAVRSAGAGSRRSAQRLGADVLVLVAAGVAAWQLARYGGPLRAGEVDPLLVLAPALLLLAGCLGMLRALPVALAVAQPWAGRRRGLTGALAAWTVSRQLGRQVGPVLTVLLSASVVAFSLMWLSSWNRSAEDQAEFAAGADVRITDIGELGHEELSGLPGVTAVMPVARSADSFGDTRAELLAMDVAVADEVLRLRDDLADQPVSTLLAPLADASSQAGLVLPDGTVALELDDPSGAPAAQRSAVVQDGTGVLHAAAFEPGASASRPRAELGAVPGPLSLLGIQQRAGGGDTGRRESVDPAFYPVDASGDRGERLTPAEGLTWRAVEATPGRELLMAGTWGGGALPAVVTRGLAETVGDQTLVADANGLSLRLEVVGVVDGLPSVDPTEAEGVVVDLTAMNQAVLAQSGALPTSDREWWLDVEADASKATVAALTRAYPQVTVVDTQSRLESLESGPVGTAVVGVLAVALVTAGLTALSGIAASAGALGPARRREAALLRAIGADPRQIARLAALDRAALLAVAGLSGVAVGLAVAWWALPRIALTDSAVAPYPPLSVEAPWAVLGLGAAALLAVGLLLHAWSARRRRAVAPSRGEELP
ncbi:MAG TPA: FtsX-like permease family protein [Marmoricola sp.]|nr:FtsX-like permease family protein [Marmoricola sp.]